MQTESYDSVRELARLNAEIAATSEHLTLPDLNESINSVNVDFAITKLRRKSIDQRYCIRVQESRTGICRKRRTDKRPENNTDLDRYAEFNRRTGRRDERKRNPDRI